MIKPVWRYYCISIGLLIIDQYTKYLAVTHLVLYKPLPILPLFNLTLAYNKGIAFSILHDGGFGIRWFFVGFSLIISGYIIKWMWILPRESHAQLAALSLVLGGALGNMYDRVRLGYVIDFLDIYWKHLHWPIFNIADSVICIGAVCLSVNMIFFSAFETAPHPRNRILK